MSTPPQPSSIILPTGATAWLNPYSGTYTTSHSYAMRMQRNYARGLTQSEARGHRASPTGVTEAMFRRQQDLENYGQTPWQRFTRSFERRYGFSYSYWKKLRRLGIDRINQLSSPGMQVTPGLVAQELQMEDRFSFFQRPGPMGKAWLEQRIPEKLYSMEQYRNHNRMPGNQYFAMRDSIRPVEWWYYH